MSEWVKRQWDDIKGNVKYALLVIVLGAVVTGLAVLVRGLPWWKDAILVFLFVLVAFWAAVATWWRRKIPDTNAAIGEIKNEFEKLADEDSAEMGKRLITCGISAKLELETVEPYVDVTFRLVNTSMFNLMSEKVEGNAFYRGYSGEKFPLSRSPIIADPMNFFSLPRGQLRELTLRQFVPLAITDNIAANNDRLTLDLTEVRVHFMFPGTGDHRRFCWFGDEVEVVGGLAVSNEKLSNLSIIPKRSGAPYLEILTPLDHAEVGLWREVHGSVRTPNSKVQLLVHAGDDWWYLQGDAEVDGQSWSKKCKFGLDKPNYGGDYTIIALLGQPVRDSRVRDLPDVLRSNEIKVRRTHD